MGEHGQGTGPFAIQTKAGPRWRVAVTMSDGTRVWRTRRTKRLAEDARRELVERRELELDPSRQTLEEYLRSWVDGLRKARNRRIAPRTLDRYEVSIDLHIVPALGHLKLAAVSGRRIQEWIDAQDSAPNTIRNNHAVLRRALNIAVKRDHLLAYNPALAVELPEADGDVRDPFTLEEARSFLAETHDDRLGVLWRLAVVTGLRQAELLGLTWDDVGEGGIRVQAQLQRLRADQGGDQNGWARTEPKAARKVSRIALDPDTGAALEAHRRRQADERRADWPYFGLVFVTERGRPIHQSEIDKAFKRACARAGIRPRRFHDLRHSSAALLTDAGVAEDTRMARMGHNTTAMARHYAGGSGAQDRDAAERLGRALEG